MKIEAVLQNLEMRQTQSKGEVYSDTDLAQETKNISNKQFNMTYTGSRNRRTKPKVNIRNNKDHRAKKKQWKKSNKRSVKLRANYLKIILKKEKKRKRKAFSQTSEN